MSDGRFKKTHGKSYDREYKTYHAMIQRCTNANDPSYPRYGGKGVVICDRWLESFENFYADMGTRPARTTLDRINGTLGYEPGNCRWATALEQNTNRDTTIPVTIRGVLYPSIAECCRVHGLPISTYHNRIRRGWSEDRSATEAIAPNTGKAIEVAGVSYPTITALLRAYSVTKKRFYEGINAGLTTEQALGI